MKIEMFCDGSALGNPGFGGYAAILLAYDNNGNLLKEEIVTGGDRDVTNNAMEIAAVIAGLQKLTRPTRLTIFTDSQYIVGTMTQRWKRKANHAYWLVLDELASQHEIEWVHVNGHSGNIYNEKCDKLAREAAERMKSG